MKKMNKIKKVALTLLLATASSAAMADWMPIQSNKDYFIISYNEMRKLGNVVQLMVLINAEKHSIVNIVEYNCSSMSTKVTHVALHGQPMGGGKVEYSTKDDDGQFAINFTEAMGDKFETACKMFYDDEVRKAAKFLDDVNALRK